MQLFNDKAWAVHFCFSIVQTFGYCANKSRELTHILPGQGCFSVFKPDLETVRKKLWPSTFSPTAFLNEHFSSLSIFVLLTLKSIQVYTVFVSLYGTCKLKMWWNFNFYISNLKKFWVKLVIYRKWTAWKYLAVNLLNLVHIRINHLIFPVNQRSFNKDMKQFKKCCLQVFGL
jgi:hypothetical protein